jgi:hypothetical protein
VGDIKSQMNDGFLEQGLVTLGLRYPASQSILYECPSSKSMRQLRHACIFAPERTLHL